MILLAIIKFIMIILLFPSIMTICTLYIKNIRQLFNRFLDLDIESTQFSEILDYFKEKDERKKLIVIFSIWTLIIQLTIAPIINLII